MRRIGVLIFPFLMFVGTSAATGAKPPPTVPVTDPVVAARNAGSDRVSDMRGNFVGTAGSEVVQLPAGVIGRPVYAANGSGKVVGYMTFGDMGFVDRKTARNSKAFKILAQCYAEMSAGTALSTKCRAAFVAQGVDKSQLKSN